MSAERRVGIVGCGDVAAVHLDVIEAMDGARLVAVCDSDDDRLRVAVAASGVAGFTDHRVMFAQAGLDVVHIATPHAAHAPIAIDALDAGIHVVLEKPLAHSSAAGAQIVAAEQRSTATLAACFQNRYNAPVQRMHELLASGELGAVHSASATVVWSRGADYYRARPWRGTWAEGGGGLLMNQAIHTVDLMIWLLGDVEHITGGIANRSLPGVIEVEDTADLLIDHVGGVRSVLFATLAGADNEPVTITITTDAATLHYADDLTVRYPDGSVEVTEQILATGERAYWGLSHAALIADFYRSLDTETPFWIDSRAAQKSLDAVQEVYRLSGHLAHSA